MGWFRKSREQDLQRELRSHLELEAQEQQESGRSPDDAPSAARRAFGNTTLVKEDMRAMWTWTPIDRLAQDLRYAIRTMRKNLGFSAAAILSLALARLGRLNVPVYDGSWTEWGGRDDTPVVMGPADAAVPA